MQGKYDFEGGYTSADYTMVSDGKTFCILLSTTLPTILLVLMVLL
jgi:hypothetical protein